MKKKILKEQFTVIENQYSDLLNKYTSALDRCNKIEEYNNVLFVKNSNQKKSIEELQMKLAASEATTKKAQERWGHTEKLLQETILERNRLATWVDKFRASGNALKVCLYKFLAFYFKSKLTVNIQKTKDLIEKLKQTEKETRTNLEIFETEVKEYKLVDLVHRYRDYGWITCKDTLHQPPAWFNPEENFFTKETKAQFDERIQLHKSFLASKTDTFREEYTKSPITSLVRALKNAPEYRETWVANIAQAFICEMEKSKSVLLLDDGKKDLHRIANTAANNFLNQLCAE